MAVDVKEIRSTLNGLIATCKDGEEGFRTSASKLRDSKLREIFESYANQYASFASDLQNEVNRIGGEATTSGSAAGAMRRVWMDLKTALSRNDDRAILEEAERAQDSIVKEYRDAMSKDLPSDIRSVIERQYRQVQQIHNSVRALRDTGQAPATGPGSTM